MDEKEFRKKTTEIALDLFNKALQKKDFFECAKAIGVLEMLRDPSVASLSSMAFSMVGDYKKSIEYINTIPKDSMYYRVSQQGLVYAYLQLGDYLSLDACLKEGMIPTSPLEEMDLRLRCLMKMESDYYYEHRDKLYSIEMSDVFLNLEGLNDHESALFFSVCRTFSICLKLACDCIYECIKYQDRRNEKYEDFSYERSADLSIYISVYEKLCYILSQSKHLKSLMLPDNITSLADFVFDNIPWNEKLIKFSEEQYDIAIIQTIYSLCDPMLHKNIDSYEAVEQLLELYIEIRPSVVAEIIDLYFDEVSKAYNSMSSSAIQYVGYAYSEILATNNDRFMLKKRIEDLRKNDNFDFEKVSRMIILKRVMSHKGYTALINAYASYWKVEDDIHGAEDFSTLSLQFFRVIEFEYSEKLIIPLAKSICNSEFTELLNECNNENKDKWRIDFAYIRSINEKGQSSIQIGAVRNLLYHAVGKRFRADRCADYLREHIYSLLSEEGRMALDNQEMLNVIDSATLKKYRIPGAHTGFLPFSTAKESKEYVERYLPIIEKWFI